MDHDLNHRLDYELITLRNNREKYIQRLDLCRGFEQCVLRQSNKSNDKVYYYSNRPGISGHAYLGRSNHPEVQKIREAHFLSEAIRRIDSNIELVTSFKKDYLSYDMYSVSCGLPAVYRSDVPPVSLAYQREGSSWKAGRLAFQAMHPENYPQNKRERTSDGVMVKTVSEVVLYERLKDAGLAFIYELPLVLRDYGPAMYPDFTVLSPVDMKTEILVEYAGRLDLPQYRDDFARRLNRYISNGWIPGVNLFFVYGDKDGHIDSLQISRVISDICGIGSPLN